MRVFDTFLFDGELDLLRHRLEESYDLVDFYVLVEAARTYRGRPKPLTFHEHAHDFAWAAAKIRPIALDSLGGPALTSRERAQLQRNAIILGLRDAHPDDVVLILDADEIPSRDFLLQLRAEGLSAPSRLAMTRHYEFIDTVAPASPCCPSLPLSRPLDLHRVQPDRWERLQETWHGCSGVAVRYRDFAEALPFNWRFTDRITAVLSDTGRHLTAIDPAARLERKLDRVFHDEYADVRGLSALHLRRCRKYGVHHRGWWYAEIPQGSLPADLQRLCDRHPDMRRQRMPNVLSRRVVRSWAALRLQKSIPAKLVQWIDRYFFAALPIIFAPLLLIDLLRTVVSACRHPTQGVGAGSSADHRI